MYTGNLQVVYKRHKKLLLSPSSYWCGLWLWHYYPSDTWCIRFLLILKRKIIPISGAPFLLKAGRCFKLEEMMISQNCSIITMVLGLDPRAVFLIIVSVTRASGAGVWNKNPGKVHALLPLIDLPSSLAFLNCYFCAFCNTHSHCGMVSQQKEPSPLIPSPGNSRSLCRKWSAAFFNTWIDLSVKSCPHKCPIICHIFCCCGS